MNSTVSYFARVLNEIEYNAGQWRGVRVGVFRQENDREVQVGEYERNYPSLLHTFTPFRAGGRDLALYSPDYTCTRLLELPSCRDIGGEEPNSGGFCPADLFVPYFIDVEYWADEGPRKRLRRQMPKPESLTAQATPVRFPAYKDRPERTEIHHEAPVGPLTYHPFGFVAGCIWGDDSSWKLQYLDLSEAANGIVRRDERFGYIELPDRTRLDDAIDLIDFQSDPVDEYAHHVRITLTRRFDLRTGHVVDPLS